MASLFLRVGLLLVVVVDASAQPTDPPVDPKPLMPPASEVVTSTLQITLPPLPMFDVPPPAADGSLTPRRLRVSGKPVLDQDIAVTGVVTYAYDCVKANMAPGTTERQVREQIDRDPTLCERAKFYVGDAATTDPERSLWIVDVPRPYTKLDMTRLKKKDRDAPDKCEPDEKDPARKICPPYKVGDRVVVIGTFKLASPHSERNSDGLLVYKRMKNLTQRWESPGAAPALASLTPRATPAWLAATPPPPPAVPAKAKVPRSVSSSSVSAANQGTIAYGQRQWETAIDRYTKAVATWPENSSAYYGLSAAHAQKRDWATASDAVARAVALEPRIAMYRLMYGRTLYEKLIQRAKVDQAARENVRPEDVEVDLSAINFEKPLLELRTAVQLEPALWRAHYLIGSIHRYAGDPKGAAGSFFRALKYGPVEPAPWIATAELLRAWDYTDQAIQIATIATTIVLGSADCWFELGMAYDDKRLDDKAIPAFDKALELDANDPKSRFARGQAYFRKGAAERAAGPRKAAFAKAKADLEQFLKLGNPSVEFFKQQASRMLMDIAARS